MLRLLRGVTLVSRRQAGSASVAPDYLSKIGNREVVGHGYNGQPTYMDRVDFPFPAIRFKPNTPEIKKLREKEKGDWKSLTLEEKKALYRASFCQTLAEVEAPTGEWKSVVGWALIWLSVGLWLQMFIYKYVYDGTRPDSFKEDRRQAQLKRMLAFRMNPIDGISSKYDFEKNEWKK